MTLEELATHLNRLRVFPRLLVIAATIYIGWYAWEIGNWYMLLTSPGVEETGFAGSVITLLIGIVKFMIDKYMSTGRND